MAGVAQAGGSLPIRVFNTVTPNAAVAEENLVDIVPCTGFGTYRLFCFSTTVGTLRVYQANRCVGTAVATAFRQTDAHAVAASGTTMTFVGNIVADYLRVTYTPTAAVPVTFQASGHLVP